MASILIAFVLLLSPVASSLEGEFDAKVARQIGAHPGRFDGKVCFITGATSGIGEHVAYHLATEGCAIVATGRREERGAAVVDHINTIETKSTMDPPALFIPVDVTKPETIRAAVAQIEETYGRLDAIMANAGVAALSALDGSEEREEEFDWIIDVNVNGVFRTVNAAVGLMKQTGGGGIVINSSIYGLEANGYMAAYITSKHALEGMKKVLAAELFVHGIRVNNVNPSFTATDMIQALGSPVFKSYADNIIGNIQPDGKISEMGDVSSVVAWLLSEDSSYVNGVSIQVDGGNTGQTIPVKLMHQVMGDVATAMAEAAATAEEEPAKEEL